MQLNMCTMCGRLCKRSRRVDVAVEKAAVVKKVWWRDFLKTGRRDPLGNSDSFEAASMQAWFMHVQQPPITVTPFHKTPCLFAIISRQARVFLRPAGDKWVFGQQAEYRSHACQPIGSLSIILQQESLMPRATPTRTWKGLTWNHRLQHNTFMIFWIVEGCWSAFCCLDPC